MNKHTPGPWSLVRGNYPGFIEIHGTSFKVSLVTSAADLNFEGYMARMADAKLMSASPELLEALELWLSDYYEWASKPEFEPHPYVAERVAKTHAAIAKARGQS